MTLTKKIKKFHFLPLHFTKFMMNFVKGASIISRVSCIFETAIKSAFPMLNPTLINVSVEQNNKPTMRHDYQCNA